MNKMQLLLIPLIFLMGCLGGESIAPDTATAIVGTAVDAAATALPLLGPWGAAGGLALTSLYGAFRSYSTHRDKKKLVMNLGRDAYDKYKSLQPEDKKALDEDMRRTIAPKYQKYYDMGKNLIP